jgi:cytochrome b subunit of formate dehydrogenase
MLNRKGFFLRNNNTLHQTVLATIACWTVVLSTTTVSAAPTAATCLECHSDKAIVSESNPRRSVYFDKAKFDRSVHAKINCIECHLDANVEDFPHQPKLQPAQCDGCHAAEVKAYLISRHSATSKKPELPGSTCIICHGKHDILPVTDPASPINPMNVPTTCGKCHNEEASVPMGNGMARTISFTDAIHMRGLKQRGLKVTATCTSCHGAHAILPFNDQRSTISRKNSAATCSKCHSQLESIHAKVIKAGLWRATPTSYPVCVDCHDPHKGFEHEISRSEFSDRSCMKCHGDSTATVPGAGRPPAFVRMADIKGSAHLNVPCVQCHVNVSINKNPVCAESGKVQCASCHDEVAEMYDGSIHAKLRDKGDKEAPTCVTCHGDHAILSKKADGSPISRLNSPQLCGKCHKLGGAAALREKDNPGMWEKYTLSVHGKGVIKSGLTVSAVCVDCHSTHGERAKTDTASTVYRTKIAATCSKCHEGIDKDFNRGVHSPLVTTTDKKLPVCSDCHLSHDIVPVTGNEFRTQTMEQCGSCHKKVAESYFETYHGKGSRLGDGRTARCSDCHGAHLIRRPEDTLSPLSKANIVATCQKCHAKSGKRFAAYGVHASPRDKKNYPLLYFTFWAMNLLLIGVFTFFGVHTLLWFPRSLKQFLHDRKQAPAESTQWVRRFSPFYSLLHVFVIISFLSLALTGMVIKFSYASWAIFISHLFGGTEACRMLHRTGAIITFGYFVFHLGELTLRIIREKLNIFDFLFLRESMIPSLRDVKEFFQTIRWFFGKGPRPQYGRWTYWEKFDYFAVFWGVAIIGLSGLILWFPVFFTLFLPGWCINIALIIHSDEALLAVGFIFTIHFFNTHFRPEKFPMDTVIFSGKVPLSEFIEERPREYEELVSANKLETLLEKPPTKKFMLGARVFGFLALCTGIILICLVLWAMLFRNIVK